MDKVYVVTMYKYADRSSYSYVRGVYSHENIAINVGLYEESYKAGRYKCEVIEFELDNECIDYFGRTVLPLERDNPLDLDTPYYVAE